MGIWTKNEWILFGTLIHILDQLVGQLYKIINTRKMIDWSIWNVQFEVPWMPLTCTLRQCSTNTYTQISKTQYLKYLCNINWPKLFFIFVFKDSRTGQPDFESEPIFNVKIVVLEQILIKWVKKKHRSKKIDQQNLIKTRTQIPFNKLIKRLAWKNVILIACSHHLILLGAWLAGEKKRFQ